MVRKRGGKSMIVYISIIMKWYVGKFNYEKFDKIILNYFFTSVY